MSGATFRTGDVVRTTYSSSPRDERLVVTGYIETGEVDVYPEGGDPVGQSLLFPADRLELLEAASADELDEPDADGIIRHVPWPVDTGAPRPDSAAHRSFSLAGLASVRRAPMFDVGEDA